MTHQMEVVGYHHDAIAGSDTRDGNEADQCCDADILQRQVGQENAADESHGNVCKHLDGEHGGAEVAVE